MACHILNLDDETFWKLRLQSLQKISRRFENIIEKYSQSDGSPVRQVIDLLTGHVYDENTSLESGGEDLNIQKDDFGKDFNALTNKACGYKLRPRNRRSTRDRCVKAPRALTYSSLSRPTYQLKSISSLRNDVVPEEEGDIATFWTPLDGFKATCYSTNWFFSSKEINDADLEEFSRHQVENKDEDKNTFSNVIRDCFVSCNRPCFTPASKKVQSHGLHVKDRVESPEKVNKKCITNEAHSFCLEKGSKLKEEGTPKFKEKGSPKLKEEGNTKLKEEGNPKLKEEGNPNLKEGGNPKLKEGSDSSLKETKGSHLTDTTTQYDEVLLLNLDNDFEEEWSPTSNDMTPTSPKSHLTDLRNNSQNVPSHPLPSAEILGEDDYSLYDVIQLSPCSTL